MDLGSWICHRCNFRSIPGLPRPLLCPEDGEPLVREELLERYPDDPLLGTLVEGRFAVVDRLTWALPGRGYEALSLPGGDRVALHAALPDELGGSVDTARFFRGADTLRQLNHPGLVGILQFGTLPEGGCYLVTESCSRPTLHQWLKEHRQAGWPGALDLLRPVLEGLVRPHERGVAYGTVLPSRLLLREGEPSAGGAPLQLAGLGFEQLFVQAKAANGRAPSRVNLDANLASYMSPEEIRLEPLGPTSDVYSLGCVLHHLVTGAPPYPGQRPLEIISAHLAGRYPRGRGRGLFPELAAVLAMACATRPGDRQAGAGQLLAALDLVASGSPAGRPLSLTVSPVPLSEPVLGATPTPAAAQGSPATLALPALRPHAQPASAAPEPTVARPPVVAPAPDSDKTVAMAALPVMPPREVDKTVAMAALPVMPPREVDKTVAMAALPVMPPREVEKTVRLPPRGETAPREVEKAVRLPSGERLSPRRPRRRWPCLPGGEAASREVEKTVALPPRGEAVPLESEKTVALEALPVAAPPGGGRETVMLTALDPGLVQLQEEYQRKQDEAAREKEEALRAEEEEKREAERRVRHQRLLSRLVVGTAALLVLAGGGTWLYLELRHPDVPLYTLDPELQAFLAGMPDDVAATPLPSQLTPAQLREEARVGVARLVEESWDALLESQRSIEIAKTHLHSAGGREQARVAAGELVALAGELRRLRREGIELKVALPQANDEQLEGIVANSRRLAANLIEARARVQAALDDLLETLPAATAAALRVPTVAPRPRPTPEETLAEVRPVPRGAPRTGSGQPAAGLLPAGGPPSVPAASSPAAAATVAAGQLPGPQPASELATLSDEELLVRVLGPQEKGPIAVSGLACSCDADRLARSVGAGAKGESLSPCEVQACAKVPAGSQRYSEVALNLSRYHFFRQQFKEQLAALQRATNFGQYSHDPAVLFQLIAVAARLGSFKVALEAKDRFLYVKELLPPAEREKKVPEAYRILGLAFEARFYRVLDDNPDRADPALLNRAIDYLERYSDSSNRPPEMEAKLAELRVLQKEVAGDAP